MTEGRRLALVGDIGSTNVRFAISDVDETSIAHFVVFQTSMFEDLRSAIAAYYRSIPHRPDMVGLAVAAPVTGDSICMPNAGWSFSVEDVRKATGAGHVRIINEFEALALALPGLAPHDMKEVGEGFGITDAPRLVLGPGTGFGAAALLRSGNGWSVLPSEAGEVSFGATDEEELALLERLAEDSGRVTVENVLSAGGLQQIYAMFAEKAGIERRPSAAEIVAMAEHEHETTARRAIELFVQVLGRTAGDTALALGARGGIFLGGGIAPKIVEELKRSIFQLAVKAQVCTASRPEPIPVHVITANDAGLRGAAAALSDAYPMVRAA